VIELKTSEEWQKIYPQIKVLNPDGWDRSNFQFSWYREKISNLEYEKRLCSSTVQGDIIKFIKEMEKGKTI